MASLTGQQIDQTYQGLIKTSANAAVSFPPASLEDGAGNTIGIKLGDGTGIGAGLITQIEGNPGAPGTPLVGVDGNLVTINKIGSLSADGGTASIIGGNNAAGTFDLFDGTFNFGNAFTTTNVDFTNATVTGLPSGAAGLENGTGTDSLQSAAALTTNPANAAGNGSIAIGDGASATRQESVAIGQGAEANGSGSEGSIAIGHGSIASSNRGIAIGINGTTNSSEGIVIGDDVDISGSDRSVAIGGAINITGGSDKVAIGTSASVTGNRGLAFGQNASATGNEAIAMGYNVTAAKAQTLSVNALETQTNSTPTAGGIIMSDAGGTERRLNITATGDLQIDSTAVGGGGAALHALGGNLEGRTYYDSGGTNPQSQYRTWVNTTGGFTSTAAVFNRAAYSLFTMVPAEQINKVAINVAQAAAGATGEIAFYDTQVNSDGFIYLDSRLTSLGTVDMSTTGWKEITLGTPFVVPGGKTNNTIAIVAFPSSTSANFGGWNSSMAMVGQGIFLSGGAAYRALHMHANPGVSPGTALPATIGDAGGSVDYKASTSNPLAVMIK